jgi:aminoglycoside phosphotransferase (APT) family kinase protein
VIDAQVASRLIARQFPNWSHLAVTPVASAGTDNAIFRLGEALAIRMPKVDWAADTVARECQFLPRFAKLPLQTPVPVARGEPDETYPYVWCVCEWIEGEALDIADLENPVAAAQALSAFVVAMRKVDAHGGPRAAPGNNLRGGALGVRDARTRAALANLGREIDAAPLFDLWDRALAVAPYDGPGVWIHSDLKQGNMLMHGGALAAVIDFGLMAVGDPAVDLTAAWSFFGGPSRDQYLGALAPTHAELARAQGWALSIAAIAWDFYRDRNPTLTAISRRTIKNLREA